MGSWWDHCRNYISIYLIWQFDQMPEYQVKIKKFILPADAEIRYNSHNGHPNKLKTQWYSNGSTSMLKSFNAYVLLLVNLFMSRLYCLYLPLFMPVTSWWLTVQSTEISIFSAKHFSLIDDFLKLQRRVLDRIRVHQFEGGIEQQMRAFEAISKIFRN